MRIAKFQNFLLCFGIVVITVLFNSCQKDDVEDSTGATELTDIGPGEKILGENITITGKNLGRVTAVKLPGIANPISNFVSKTNDKIVLVAPKTTVEGKVILVTPTGEVTSKSNINFKVIFSVMEIPTEVEAGGLLTIKGEYLNWITEIWFSDQVKVTSFVSSSMNELVVKVPFEAQTGPIKLIGDGTTPMTFTSKTNLIIKEVVFKPDFVYVKGKKLFLNGNEWIAHGGSLYPTGPSSGYKESGFKDYMKSMLDLAVKDKFTNVRIVNYFDGNTDNVYDAEIWSNIDYLVAEAGAHNLKVILDLSSFRNYLLAKKGIMPYNYADWKDMIDFVGKRYKDNSAVWLYSLAGEAEGPRAGDNAHVPLRPTTAQLNTFYKEASNALNLIAPNQLISNGGFIFLDYDSGIDWKTIFTLPNIHVPAIHIYGDGGMKNIVPTINAVCKDNNKPLFIEEFGIEKTVKDNVISKYFQDIYTISKNNELVGACFWNYGPQTNNNSFDINSASTPITLATVRVNSPLK